MVHMYPSPQHLHHLSRYVFSDITEENWPFISNPDSSYPCPMSVFPNSLCISHPPMHLQPFKPASLRNGHFEFKCGLRNAQALSCQVDNNWYVSLKTSSLPCMTAPSLCFYFVSYGSSFFTSFLWYITTHLGKIISDR